MLPCVVGTEQKLAFPKDNANVSLSTATVTPVECAQRTVGSMLGVRTFLFERRHIEPPFIHYESIQACFTRKLLQVTPRFAHRVEWHPRQYFEGI